MEDRPGFAAPGYDDSAWASLGVRGYWNPITGEGDGYGWYRSRILLGDEGPWRHGKPLGIEVEFIQSAYELYVDGKLVAGAGKFATDKLHARPQIIPRIAMIDLPEGSREIVVAVRNCNFSHRAGGPYYIPRIGLYDDLKQRRFYRDFLNLIMLGILLMMGLYHLLLWAGRIEDRASLFFTAGCCIIFLRLLATQSYLELLFPDASLYEVRFKIVYLSMPAGWLSFIFFFRELFREEFRPNVLRFFVGSGLLLIAVTLLLPCRIYSHFSIIYEVLLLASGVWMFAVMLVAAARRRTWALYMVPGFFLLFATGLNDLLAVKLVIHTPEIAPIGLVGLIFFQAAVLSKRFAHAFRTAEHLSKNLQAEVESKTRELVEQTDRALEAKKEAEMSKKELEAGNAKLREVDRFKTVFYQNITHEFRTPLTLIIGSLENITTGTHGVNSEEALRQLGVALHNARRLLHLINQLLDVSRMEEGKEELMLERFDIVKVLRDVSSSFEPVARRKNIDYAYHSDVELLYITADLEKIEKVFYNLLSNAFKFTPDGGAINMVLALSGDRVEVKIRDTGIGIRETDIGNIFERFYQEDATATRRHEGSGIGLALVREYVRLHNGTVHAWSVKGSGSEFVVALPVGLQEPREMSAAADEGADRADSAYAPLGDLYVAGLLHAETKESRGADGGVTGRQGADTILVVDDNADMRHYISGILKDRYRICTASDGKEALEKIREIGPSLVVSDVMMPEMDGIEMLHALRSGKETRGLPVILITARATEESKVASLEGGADDYISKPFNARELLARVGNILKMKAQEKDLLAAYEKLNMAYTGIKNDLGLARAIQEKLFPTQIEPIRGMRFEVRYVPLIEVGGDIYDICETDNGIVRIFLSDATGHGVSASLITMLIKGEYDMIKHTSSGPLEIIHRLNEVFFSTYRSVVTFFTGIVVDIDVAAGRITYSSAGHPGQFLVHAGKIVEMVTTGRAVGLGERTNCHEERMPYQAGDKLLLFTDGLCEEINGANELFGEERIGAAVARNIASPVEKIVEALFEEVCEFTGDRFRDDITIIGIE